MCEIIERLPNLMVLAGPKSTKFPSLTNQGSRHFQKFYAPFQKYPNYALDEAFTANIFATIALELWVA